MTAWRDESGVVYGLAEVVAGVPYSYGVTEGDLWECKEIGTAWPPEEWKQARLTLGVPMEWCTSGSEGERCPPWVAHKWGAIKSMYR